MPTYTYQCLACAHRFDAVQSIHDDALTECPQCAAGLRKVFGSVGVSFKGSGFYRNDSRAKTAKSATPASAKAPSSSSTSSTTGAAPAPASASGGKSAASSNSSPTS